MRIQSLIGSIFLLAACASAPTRPFGDAGVSGRWQGEVLRNDGLSAPIAVDFFERDREWEGKFSSGSDSPSTPLQDVHVTATKVRFQVPGEAVFEGSVFGDSIAGSVSGTSSGSFKLSRQAQQEWSPYVFGP